MEMTRTDIAEANSRFGNASPQEILAWAIKTHGAGAALSSSFGGQSAALIHMAIQIEPRIPILFIDTGFLFKETHAFAAELTKRFNLNLKIFRASPAQIEQTRRNLAARDANGDGPCCDDAKVDLMKQSLADVSCWIAGLRRSQGSQRKDIGIVEHYSTGLVKVHPLANWSGKELYSYMKQHALPFHPLWEKGFTSIGCEPCTSLPTAEGQERSGRWAGTAKTECGIHTFMKKDN